MISSMVLANSNFVVGCRAVVRPSFLTHHLAGDSLRATMQHQHHITLEVISQRTYLKVVQVQNL